jgi:23S rRNA pseudouridine955/2504/2580 synthase
MTVDPASNGQRIDNYLIKILKKVPKSRIYRMLRSGEVRVDGKRVQPLFRLVEGQMVRVPPVTGVDEAEEVVRPPTQLVEALQRRILHQDTDLLVLDKPAGIAVHSGSGNALGAVEALKAVMDGFLELVHRLDRDTSGVLLFARSPRVLKSLQLAFRERAVSKIYRAVVHGRLDVHSKQISSPLRRYLSASGERRVRVDDAGGQEANTTVTTLAAGDLVSTLQVEIGTGRTHQIRVHLAELGHPVVGDEKYGEQDPRLNRLAGRLLLHAERIAFSLDGQSHLYEARVPDVFSIVQCSPAEFPPPQRSDQGPLGDL